MLNKLKRLYHTDNFSYFIRYFAVFTLIFGLMTMIIFQLMRSTIYHASDKNFEEFKAHPNLIVKFAIARGISSDAEVVLEPNSNIFSDVEEEVDKEEYAPFKPSSKLRLNTNYHVILYDRHGRIANELDMLSGLSEVDLDTKHLNEVVEKTVTTAFNEDETYRMMTVDISNEETITSLNSSIHYATVLFNTTQLKEAIKNYETTVILVMISFWLISIFASVYLSKVSVKPILVSFQKQKDFVENASHELRTPLAVLQNRLENLFRKPTATILERSEDIASSLEEVRNMRILTTNLLNLARRDDGLKTENIPIAPTFFDSILENYALIAEETNRQLQINQQIKQTIYTDKTLLKQLMTILYDNAIKYTNDGGHIRLTLAIKDRCFFFQVADDGIGISDEHKKKIFDRFYRVDKARTRQKGGFGLGLSLAKQISDSLKGTIIVKNNEPTGSIFEVRIPLK